MKQKMIKLAEFTYEEVIGKINTCSGRVPFEIDNSKYFVRMNSQRYFLFRKQRNCYVCGLYGQVFFLEKLLQDKNPHFNLYSKENDNYVLMTKDHIIPRSKGGKNNLSNYNTCCSICNFLKDNCEINKEKILELRTIWNENINKIEKKDLMDIIRNKRNDF